MRQNLCVVKNSSNEEAKTKNKRDRVLMCTVADVLLLCAVVWGLVDDGQILLHR